MDMKRKNWLLMTVTENLLKHYHVLLFVLQFPKITRSFSDASLGDGFSVGLALRHCLSDFLVLKHELIKEMRLNVSVSEKKKWVIPL